MQSWLNLMQLEQRPSSVCSKPEQRIYRGKKVSKECLNGIHGDGPCVSCSSDRQWQSSGAGLELGAVLGVPYSLAAGAGLDMGPGEEGARAAIHEDQADGTAAAAGDGGGVDGRPCRVEALAEGEEAKKY
jgi:hypothetical protein